jgi:hypothetical protein
MKLPAALVLFAIAASAQSFDVASVKLTTNIRPGYGNEHILARPGSLSMSNVRLRAMIKWAYDVKDYQVSGPSWLGPPGWLAATWRGTRFSPRLLRTLRSRPFG